MGNPVKMFIVEGEDRDYRFINEMTSCFFETGKFQSKVICLPATQNIYMLYKLLADDDFDTDIVEVLRDNVPSAIEILDGISRQDIDEVFLFFDYDIHQNNLSADGEIISDDVLQKMLSVFNNETDNGKLFISYPMVEALYDYKSLMCESYSGCYISIDDVKDYKRIAGEGNINSNLRFGIIQWQDVLEIYLLRIKCLFNLQDISYVEYRKIVSSETIYAKEKSLKDIENRVFVLSAFPQFLFDYFKDVFWNKYAKLKKMNFDNCYKN